MKINYYRTPYKPVFVYGSLLRGLPNHHVISGETIAYAEGTVDGVQLFANGNAFPFAFKGEGTISGELVYLDDFLYPASIRSLDDLEGYSDSDNDLYKRITVDVHTADGTTQAWMYIGVEDIRSFLTDMPYIPSGSWREFLSTYVKA